MIKLLLTSWLMVVFLYPTILFVYGKISQSSFSQHAKRNLTWVWVVLFLGGPALGLMGLDELTRHLVILACILFALHPLSVWISAKLSEVSLTIKTQKVLTWLWVALCLLGPMLGKVSVAIFFYGIIPPIDTILSFDWFTDFWRIFFRTGLFPFYTLPVISVFIWSCIRWVRKPNPLAWYWSFTTSWVFLSFLGEFFSFNAR